MRSVLTGLCGILLLASACGDKAEQSSGEGADSQGDGDGDGDGESGSGSGDGDGEIMCGEDFVEKDPNAMAEDLMVEWGSPCTVDQDCVDRLGFSNAICVQDILMLYAPPGGYCTRPCELPSTDVRYVADAADCDPDGGVSCLGAKGVFSVCAPPCTNHDQCSRTGYGCILLPTLGKEGDPTFCLMDPDSCCIADGGC